jgi:hypothetical protein
MRSLLPLLLALPLACAPVRGDDDSSITDPCGGAPCEVVVSDAQASCGQGADTFTATWDGGGVLVSDGAFADGCCPDFSASALADGAAGTVTMTWDAANDFCDCICRLDASARVAGLPSGAWTFVSPLGEEAVVDVP